MWKISISYPFYVIQRENGCTQLCQIYPCHGFEFNILYSDASGEGKKLWLSVGLDQIKYRVSINLQWRILLDKFIYRVHVMLNGQ